MRSKAVQSLRGAKAAMKELVVESEHKNEDAFPLLRELFQVMADAGLWGEGLVLIGPWCFKVYQNFCGVGYFPDRTLDVDFDPFLESAVNQRKRPHDFTRKA